MKSSKFAFAAMATVALALSSIPVAAHASGGTPHPVVSWVVIDKQTFNNSVDYTHVLAAVSPGAGGHAHITKEKSVSTSVEVSLGASKGVIAGQIGFSLSASNATSVTCDSPKMKANQIYRAYARGTWKYYRVQRWEGDGLHPSTLASTSGTLMAFEPHTYPDIACQVETQ